jgi:hypothetical protein
MVMAAPSCMMTMATITLLANGPQRLATALSANT